MKLAVTGVGMVSPIGLDAATSCATARAGLVRTAPLDSFKIYSKAAWADVGIVGHSLREFAGGFTGLGKVVRLASEALADLLQTFSMTPHEVARTALIVALPSGYFQREHARDPKAVMENRSVADGFRDSLTQHFLDRLCVLSSVEIPATNRSMIFEDQSGFSTALQHAWQVLATGKCERCIVGGVDACTDADYLAGANHFNALKTESQPSGFQPGEAAAFLMLETMATARKHGSNVLASVDASVSGSEPVSRSSRKPALGVGLTETIDACLNLLNVADVVGWTLADLNGDTFRANDWGYTVARLAARGRRIGSLPITVPAESFGEIGAAQGAVASCMVVRAYARSYAPSGHALVWLASYDGGRGAFVISGET